MYLIMIDRFSDGDQLITIHHNPVASTIAKTSSITTGAIFKV